ncbi:hypothetical protein SAY86_016859 [Trapa natans]|uniref:non-specific serine/threonine protein kinase n=1 Tax=Trapa natans TaxID=22666 RepID=A0AAN7LP15_TRANT|nr:hypothetical protein SAY86_016859 [Trapa natans]
MTLFLASNAFFAILAIVSLALPSVQALGSGATLAISSRTATVCGISASQPTRHIQCFRRDQSTLLSAAPNISFSTISGGRSTFCGLLEGGSAFLCWDTNTTNSTLSPRRVYINDTATLETISVGDDHICGIVNATKGISCWRIDESTFIFPPAGEQFRSISSGSGFSCGILADSDRVRCWGSNRSTASLIQNGFEDMPMVSISVGDSNACGFNSTGFVICISGGNGGRRFDVPSISRGFEYSMVSVGEDHGCAIRSANKRVVCWSNVGAAVVESPVNGSFETVVSGSSFACGLTTGNLSAVCWGSGWSAGGLDLPLAAPILPGPCVRTGCPCGTYSLDQMLCSGDGSICRICSQANNTPPPAAPSPPSRGLRKGFLAFAIVGSVGAVAGICSVIYCLWIGGCFGRKKIHNLVQPTITRDTSSRSNTSGVLPSRSSTLRRQASRAMVSMRRQRSGPSKHPDKAEEFSFYELAQATDGFSLANKIGAGSFGVVYRGKLLNGQEVAIKRGETSTAKKLQEKETAFDSELVFLSRLHHKHLVRLVGYCEEADERLLVYEYMKNGALHDHLHDPDNIKKSSNRLNSWRMRIRIALEAARGVEYLHNYAVPPIIHRDIKSSNILLDSSWTARVSDFGLSLMGGGGGEVRPSKAAGTVGYIDPEYYSLNVLTEKSDVYGFGVVLLELLTGRRAIFMSSEGDLEPISLADYAIPAIQKGEVSQVLDPRVSPSEAEAEAVELVAYIAMHCVKPEGKDRPMMDDIVASLERALALCEESHQCISG